MQEDECVDGLAGNLGKTRKITEFGICTHAARACSLHALCSYDGLLPLIHKLYFHLDLVALFACCLPRRNVITRFRRLTLIQLRRFDAGCGCCFRRRAVSVARLGRLAQPLPAYTSPACLHACLSACSPACLPACLLVSPACLAVDEVDGRWMNGAPNCSTIGRSYATFVPRQRGDKIYLMDA